MTALAAMQHMKMPIWTFQRHLALGAATSRNCRGEVKSPAQRFLFDWRNVRLSDGPAVLLSRQRFKRARGANDKERAMSQISKTVGIDIGKNSFHVVGHDERGAIVLRQKWSRGQLEARFANMPPWADAFQVSIRRDQPNRRDIEVRGRHDAGDALRSGSCWCVLPSGHGSRPGP